MSTALRFPRLNPAGQSPSEIASRRSRTHGRFAVEANTAAIPSLEALADLAGDEDPRYDEDDPFHADLVDDDMAAPAFAVTDAFIPAQKTREQIHEAIDRNQRIIDEAPTDRLRLSDWGENAALALFDDATDQAEIDLDVAYADLEMLEQCVPSSTIDSMSAVQMVRFDAAYARAFDFAHARIGTPTFDDPDEAEEFAAYVGRALVAHDFDDTTLDLNVMVDRFDSDRAGELAAGFAAGANQRQWVQDMSGPDGMNVAVATAGGWDRRARRDVDQFRSFLQSTGFTVTAKNVGGEDPIRLFITGRPTVAVRP